MLKQYCRRSLALAPTATPRCFFCSHLCALSPRSERMEQANVLYRASRHAFLPHEPRGAGTRNKAPRTRLHEVNLPSEALKGTPRSMTNLFSFLLPLCAFVNFGLLIFLRGTQRQFLENICSEDDLRSRIFGTFVVKYFACLPPLSCSNI